ncbi:MAG: P1 family peptidase [Solirubrobacteraceae bacterium]
MEHRARLRELGYAVGRFAPGPRNALVDVGGLAVGHVTLERTGVTAVLPHSGNPFDEKVLAAVHVVNGYGKAAGLSQVEELGNLECPILLTNTFGVGAAWQGGLAWVRRERAGEGTVNVVVFECDDSPLNPEQTSPSSDDAVTAIETASEYETREGSVGAGTGMSCLGHKAGVGTSSRVAQHTLGCLVVANYGSANQLGLLGSAPEDARPGEDSVGGARGEARTEGAFAEGVREADGSIVMLLATDAPLSERQLGRLAARTTFGLARAGSFGSSASGDYALAFSTAHRIPHRSDEPAQAFSFLRDDSRPFRELLEMAGEVVHEAILNALCVAAPVPGRQALSYEALSALLRSGSEAGSSSRAGRSAGRP